MHVLLATLVLAACAPAVSDGPFSELGYEAALAQAKKEQKLVVLDFTAGWCPPCKKMDRETWAADEVKRWLGEHALALKIDTDEEGELARRFRVQALPTVVALSGDAEVARFVGYRDAAGFLEWARDARAGEASREALLERSSAMRESTDLRARWELARELQEAKLYADALAHYLWLWSNSRADASFQGTRLSFLTSRMGDLAEAHEPARLAFEPLFAELQARVDAPELPAELDWKEWVAFCNGFRQRARIGAWYEARCDTDGRLFPGSTDPVHATIRDDVFKALMREQRHGDAVRLAPDTVERVERIVRSFQARANEVAEIEDERMRETAQATDRRTLTEDLSKLYAHLLAAERGTEAAAVAGSLLATLDVPESRVALVREGVALSRTDPVFPLWLDEAAAAGLEVSTLQKRVAKLEAGATTR